LNRWALVKAPGRYEVAGSYVGETYTDIYSARPRAGPVSSDPICITVLPRTQDEMHDYIQGLTNQVMAWMAANPGKTKPHLDELVMKLMYTRSPEIVPTLLRTTYELGGEPGEGYWEHEALLYYVPRSEEIWKAITAAAASHPFVLNTEGLLQDYGFKSEDLKPVIERALAADNAGAWASGALLAGNAYYDDAFTARLIAIATDFYTPVNARGAALDALAQNRTDAGLKALRKLLNEADPGIWSALAMAISRGCDNQLKTPTGRHLHADDFDAKEMRAFIERLLASNNSEDRMRGTSLAEIFTNGARIPVPGRPAANPGSANRDDSIPSSQ